MASRVKANSSNTTGRGTPNQLVKKGAPVGPSKHELMMMMVQSHSCTSIINCEDFVEHLISQVGDCIQNIELDRFRIPCAAFQALDVANQLSMLEVYQYDGVSNGAIDDLAEEGAEEPIAAK